MFRLIDIVCTNESCLTKGIDRRLAVGEYPRCGVCGASTVRLWQSHSSAGVIGDECDLTIRHGICNDDGSPRRYRSKSEMAKVAASKQLVNRVEHKCAPGTDKSKHTSRWV